MSELMPEGERVMQEAGGGRDVPGRTPSAKEWKRLGPGSVNSRGEGRTLGPWRWAQRDRPFKALLPVLKSLLAVQRTETMRPGTKKFHLAAEENGAEGLGWG